MQHSWYNSTLFYQPQDKRLKFAVVADLTVLREQDVLRKRCYVFTGDPQFGGYVRKVLLDVDFEPV